MIFEFFTVFVEKIYVFAFLSASSLLYFAVCRIRKARRQKICAVPTVQNMMGRDNIYSSHGSWRLTAAGCFDRPVMLVYNLISAEVFPPPK